MGQHLLIDPNIARKMIALLGEDKRTPLLEIGPGLGALTAELLQCGFQVWAVEKDKRFVEILKDALEPESPGKLHLVQGDILKGRLPPRGKGRGEEAEWNVISNLPYYLTAPILFRLFDLRPVFKQAVLMMQKEVAARLLAGPGTKDYGRLTLAARYHAEVEKAFDVPRTCFTPKPEVDSTVVVLRFHPVSKRLPKMKEEKLFSLIQLAFSQRRKTLLSLLAHKKSIAADRPRLQEIFQKVGTAPTVRGEELLLKDFLALNTKVPLPKVQGSGLTRHNRKGGR